MNNIAVLILFLAIFLGPKNAFSMQHPREKAITVDLRGMKALKDLDEPTLSFFAKEILAQNLPYKSLKTRIERYCARGILPALAVERAIIMEQKSQFKRRNLAEVLDQGDHFVRVIKMLNLQREDEGKIIKAYAYCVYPLKKNENRKRLAPRVGEPVNGFNSCRHHDKPSLWRSKPAKDIDENVTAYRILINASKSMAKAKQLNDMEKVIMAKCISEQALRFFKPIAHPYDALKESARLYTRSPERAFFKERGVCNNFCAITYNIARDLGVSDNLRIAHHHLHSYLELKVGEHWYHTHPFASVSESDFIRIGEPLSQSNEIKANQN